MDKLLTWRRAMPCIAALAVFPFLVPDLVGQVTLGLALLPAAYACLRAITVMPHVRTMLLCIAAGYLLVALKAVDIIAHGGRGTYLSFVLAVTAALLFFVASIYLSHARRPHQTRDGIADGFAALAGMVVMQWQWSSLNEGATAYTIAAGTAPLVGGFLFVTLVIIFAGIARDPRQNRRILVALNLGGALIGTGVAVTGTFSSWENGELAVACYLVAGYLITAYFVSPDVRTVHEPELERPPLIAIRWLGPSLALATTPLMLVLSVFRDAVPTMGVGLACCALTGMALWRLTRLSGERERARRELLAEQRFRALVEHAADVVVVVDRPLSIRYANGGLERMLGSSLTSVVGTPLSALVDSRGGELLLATMSSLPADGASAAVAEDVLLRTSSGAPRWVAVSVTNHLDTPSIGGWVLNVHDVTERKRAEESLALLAHYDQLTGLPNRSALSSRLSALTAEEPAATALLFCDLDGFKAVNDGLGHDSGDEILQAVAGRWSALLRAGDVLGRWGGDEFLLLCPGVAGAEDAEAIARRLTAALAEPFMLQAGPATLGVSIGAVVHRAGETVAEFLARADAAMYEAKRADLGVRLG